MGATLPKTMVGGRGNDALEGRSMARVVGGNEATTPKLDRKRGWGNMGYVGTKREDERVGYVNISMHPRSKDLTCLFHLCFLANRHSYKSRGLKAHIKSSHEIESINVLNYNELAILKLIRGRCVLLIEKCIERKDS